MKKLSLMTFLFFGITGLASAHDLEGTWASPCYNQREEGTSFRIKTSYEREGEFIYRSFSFQNLGCETPGEGKDPQPSSIMLGKGHYSVGEMKTKDGNKNVLRKVFEKRQAIFPAPRAAWSDSLKASYSEYKELRESLLPSEEMDAYVNGEDHFVYGIKAEDFDEQGKDRHSIGYPMYSEFNVVEGVLHENAGPYSFTKGRF